MVEILSFFRRCLPGLLAVTVCGCCAFGADTVYGNVVNGTTHHPAPNDDVALLAIDHGELEVSRGKTTADGSFRLRTGAPGPHLLRVRHDGVIYQQQVTDMKIAQQIKVFDVQSSSLTGIHGTVTVMRVEPLRDTLEVTELHSIANDSNPPRTLVNPRNLEILLPPKATLTSVVVAAPSGRAEKVKPQPVTAGSPQYAVGYPLRPGITQFAFKYRLSYIDKATFHPRLQYPTSLWTVMFPKSMKFTIIDEGRFHEFADQNQMKVQALTEAKAGVVTGFVLSGKPPMARPQVENLDLRLPALWQHTHFQAASPVITPPSAHFFGAIGKEPSWVIMATATALFLVTGIAGIARSTKRRNARRQVDKKAG